MHLVLSSDEEEAGRVILSSQEGFQSAEEKISCEEDDEVFQRRTKSCGEEGEVVLSF